MSAVLGPFKYAATLTCPKCGRKVPCRWVGRKTAPQRCRSCGHAFDAAWPGFTFEPETIIVQPGAGDGDA